MFKITSTSCDSPAASVTNCGSIEVKLDHALFPYTERVYVVSTSPVFTIVVLIITCFPAIASGVSSSNVAVIITFDVSRLQVFLT